MTNIDHSDLLLTSGAFAHEFTKDDEAAYQKWLDDWQAREDMLAEYALTLDEEL
jgi:hypothetical protein